MPADQKPPIEGMKLVPYGMPWMAEAFWGCVLWVAGNDEFREVFAEKTGMSLTALIHRSGIEMAIDKATGYEREVICAFLDFVVENFWGEEGQPRPDDVPHTRDDI